MANPVWKPEVGPGQPTEQHPLWKDSLVHAGSCSSMPSMWASGVPACVPCLFPVQKCVNFQVISLHSPRCCGSVCSSKNLGSYKLLPLNTVMSTVRAVSKPTFTVSVLTHESDICINWLTLPKSQWRNQCEKCHLAAFLPGTHKEHVKSCINCEGSDCVFWTWSTQPMCDTCLDLTAVLVSLICCNHMSTH